MSFLHSDRWPGARRERCARARMALRLGEGNLPSPGIAITEGAGLWGNDSPEAAGGGRESRVRKWTLGKRVVKALLPPEPAGEETSLRLLSVHAVSVRLFHSNFGESGSGVSEGVTNQSPGKGINYANHHLAMDQMTPNT